MKNRRSIEDSNQLGDREKLFRVADKDNLTVVDNFAMMKCDCDKPKKLGRAYYPPLPVCVKCGGWMDVGDCKHGHKYEPTGSSNQGTGYTCQDCGGMLVGAQS